MRHTATDPGDVVHPHDAAPVGDAVRDRRERRVAAVVDVEAEQLAEEPLVRRRQEQRVAERGERVALAQQHRALRRRLAEVEPGVERDLLGREPGGLGSRGAVEEERGDVADEVVVVRLGIGDAGREADVGGDDRRAVLRRARAR